MAVKNRLEKLEKQAGLNQEREFVFLQKFLLEDGEVISVYDSAKVGDQTFNRQPEETVDEFEERIVKAVKWDHEGSVIVVQWGEAGEY